MDFGLGNAKRKEHLLCWVQSLHSPSNTFQRLFIEWLSCRFRLLYWGVLGFSAVLQHLGDWLYFKLHYISLPCPWPCHIVVIQRSRELKCFLLFLTYAHQKLSVTHRFYPWGLWMKAGNTPQTVRSLALRPSKRPKWGHTFKNPSLPHDFSNLFFPFGSQCWSCFWRNSRTVQWHSQHHKKNDCHSDWYSAALGIAWQRQQMPTVIREEGMERQKDEPKC